MPEVMEQKVTEQQEIFLTSFREMEKKLAGKEPAWLSRIRREAIERFGKRSVALPAARARYVTVEASSDITLKFTRTNS